MSEQRQKQMFLVVLLSRLWSPSEMNKDIWIVNQYIISLKECKRVNTSNNKIINNRSGDKYHSHVCTVDSIPPAAAGKWTPSIQVCTRITLSDSQWAVWKKSSRNQCSRARDIIFIPCILLHCQIVVHYPWCNASAGTWISANFIFMGKNLHVYNFDEEIDEFLVV